MRKLTILLAILFAVQLQAAEIHDAAAAGDLAKITALLDAEPAALELRTPSGKTPLHVAALAKQVAAIRLLASRKANLEAADDRGRTPLVLAAREMAGVDVVRALLDAGANVDALDSSGDSALTLATWRGSADVVALLLERNARIPADARRRQGLLEQSATKGLDALFARLLEDGADPADPSLLAPAASGGSVRILETLLAAGLDANRRDDYGWTPLHHAADTGRLAAIEFLLRKGADPRARTHGGQSAWNIAEENGDRETMALLAAKGVPQGPPDFPELRGPYLGQKRPGRTAEVFASGIVTGPRGLHSVPVFSPDGREVLWSVMLLARGESYGSGRTFVSRLENGRWTAPREAVFGGTRVEDVPFYDPAGRFLYDMARRPVPGSSQPKENIWRWRKGPRGWTDPQPLDAAVNELPQHWQFSVDRAGDLWFATTIDGGMGDGDIYVSRRADGRPQPPQNAGDAINSAAMEGMPFISPDGRTLLFCRDMDLYVSFRTKDGKWTSARKLGPEVNTRGMELLPSLSPDGSLLFFSRNYKAYWVDAAVVEELRAVELERFGKASAAGEIERIVAAGDVAKARARFDELRRDPAWFVDEGEMNALGYRLLREQRKPAEAEAVFEMNAAAFPAAWNAWDSLGEARGFHDRTSAIEAYEKSVALNPGNENGHAALRRLRGYLMDRERESREALRFPPGAPTGLRGPYLGQEPPGREPKPFAPGIVSSAKALEFAITFAPDGKEIYFTRRADEGRNAIMVSRLGADGWTAPEEAAFAKGTESNEPHVTPDGRRLYFGSMRDGGYGIWVVERTADGAWGEARPHGPGMYVSVSAAGNLYLTDISGPQGGITVSRNLGGRFGWPRRLGGGVNSPKPASYAFVAPDESFVVFDSDDRPGAQGGEGDLFVSFRQEDGSWGEGRNLGDAINGPGTNFCPSISPDGRYLFYTANRDIYWVSTAVLDELR